MKTHTCTKQLAASLIALFMAAAQGQLTWTGAENDVLTNPNNWTSPPQFDGTEALLINNFADSGRTLSLGGNLSAARLDVGDGAAVNPVATIAGPGTVTLTKSGLDNSAPTVLFRSRDGNRIDFNPNLHLDAGQGSGTFVAHFREQNNSSGGLNLNGNITQAAGESWEILANKNSARGNLRLNGENTVDRIRVNGMDITIGNPLAAGNAELIFQGGAFIFSGDRYTAPVTNQMTMLSAATLSGQLRVTGEVSQGNQTLTLNGSATQIMRFEPSSFSGTGQTTINTANFTFANTGDIATGTLTVGGSNGNSAATGVMILGGGDVPTGAEFAAARTYSQSGGANTWRFSTPAASHRGGALAARGEDLIVSTGWAGVDSSSFDRNFGLGTAATLDGELYANRAVILEQATAFTGTQRVITVAGPAAQIINRGWELNGAPVHEISGQLTGPASGDFVLAVLTGSRQGTAGSTGGTGIVRFSNIDNDFTGANMSWQIGSMRGSNSFLPSGRTSSGDNGWDEGGGIAIFTDDRAFGGADEVVVRGGGSSGTNNGGVLLFENRDGGEKTFARDFFVVQSDANGKAAFGSYAGNVRYTGTVTQSGGGNDIMVHVESGRFRMDGASLINNMTASGDHEFRKNGEGHWIVESTADFGGTFGGNYRLFVQEGGVIWNHSGVGFSTTTVEQGALLGGSGMISGNTTVAGTLSPGNSTALLTFGGNLTLQAGSDSIFQLNGTSRGVDYDAVDVGGNLTYNGLLDLSFGFVPQVNSTFTLFDVAGTQTGDFADVVIRNAGFEGSFDADTGVFTLTAIPEPSTALLLAMALVGGLHFRRRKLS